MQMVLNTNDTDAPYVSEAFLC